MPIVNVMTGLKDGPYQLLQTRIKKKLIPKVISVTSFAAYRGVTTFLVVIFTSSMLFLDPGRILASESVSRQVITSATLKASVASPAPDILVIQITPSATPTPYTKASLPSVALNQSKAPCNFGETIAQHFPPSAWSTACRVMLAESGGRPEATHINRNGTKDIGLFQLNEVHAKKVGGIIESLYDVQTNIKLAGAIYQRQGWNPWVVCKNGRVNCS